MRDPGGATARLLEPAERGAAAAALLAVAALLFAGCGEAGGRAASISPSTERPGLRVWVEAAPKTRYYAKCHIRTLKDLSGREAFGELQGYANQFVIDAAGPFKGLVPSPNAQCLFTKVSGPGEAVLHIEKGGDHAVRTSRNMSWVRLNVW